MFFFTLINLNSNINIKIIFMIKRNLAEMKKSNTKN